MRGGRSRAAVAGALDGYRNVATDDVDSVLVAPGDAHTLAGALARALSDRALTTRLVGAGATRADDFSMTTLAERYAEIYRKVALPQSASPRSVSAWPFMAPPRSAPRRRRLGRMLAQ